MTPTRITLPFSLACLVAVALALAALAALAPPSALAAPADRVGLCHATGKADRAYIFIEVNADAVGAHLAHGDHAAPNGAADCTPLPPNTPPEAVDDVVATAEDTAVAVAVLANDADAEGHLLTVTAVDPTTAAGGVAVPNADGTVGYAPPANFSGVDAFTYTISDGHSGTAAATVTVTVAAVNDPPEAQPDFAGDSVYDGGAFYRIPVLANDLDADGDALFVSEIETPPTWGELYVHDDGAISYMVMDPCLADEDAFAYEVADGQGGTDTAEVKILLHNGGSPAVISGSYATGQDEPMPIPFVDRESVGDTTWVLSLTGLDEPDHGAVVFNFVTSTVTYTPTPGFVGADQFTYVISNQYGCSGTATVTVDVG